MSIDLRIAVLCTMLFIGLLSPVLGQVGDPGQTLTRGSFVLRPARVITIPAGTTIRLSADTVLAADQIKLDGKIVTSGHLLHLDAREVAWGPAALITSFDGPPGLPPARPQASRGRDGLPNYSLPRTIRNGGPGDPGALGNPGIPGHPNPGPILYVAGHSTNSIKIEAYGQEGGRGGLGGQGGTGGNGAPGRSAWASCDGWGASCVGFGSNFSGGEPGNGGPGGRGGKGGSAGRAVPLIAALGDFGVHNQDRLVVGAGTGGAPGDPGAPGNPGSPGPAGRSDGCSSGPFGIFSCDESGAPGGATPSFPNPGNLGSDSPGEAGPNVDANLPLLAPFASHPSLLSPNGALVDLGPLYVKQADVVSIMSELHATRTYTYLLTRSLALIGYPLPAITVMRPGLASISVALRPNPEVAAIVADLWRTAFVDPLQAAVDAGDNSLPTVQEWITRGRQTVQVLLDAANGSGSSMPASLTALYRDAQSRTVKLASDAVAVCQTYAAALGEVGSQAILLSHHVVIPACSELPTLTGAQLFLEPLTIHEPLPALPDIFKPYLSDAPLQIAQAPGRSPSFSFAGVFGRLAELLFTPASAQAIDVQVRVLTPTTSVVRPKEIGVDLRRLNGKRFLVQTSLKGEPSYSAAQLIIDLQILSEMVR